MSVNILHQVAETAVRDEKSGKIHIVARIGQTNMFGNMILNNGAITEIHFVNLSAREALEKLCQSIIESAFLMPGTALGSPSTADLEISTEAVLKRLSEAGHLAPPETNSVKTDFAIDLEAEVANLLSTYLGNGIVGDIHEIAQETPPEVQPAKFLDRCKHKAAIILGENQAEKIFLALSSKIES